MTLRPESNAQAGRKAPAKPIEQATWLTRAPA